MFSFYHTDSIENCSLSVCVIAIHVALKLMNHLNHYYRLGTVCRENPFHLLSESLVIKYMYHRSCFMYNQSLCTCQPEAEMLSNNEKQAWYFEIKKSEWWSRHAYFVESSKSNMYYYVISRRECSENSLFIKGTHTINHNLHKEMHLNFAWFHWSAICYCNYFVQYLLRKFIFSIGGCMNGLLTNSNICSINTSLVLKECQCISRELLWFTVNFIKETTCTLSF